LSSVRGKASTSGTRADDTVTRILDIAERLVQTRGFNGFSYADVASELGVTTASLHYHFRGKAELGHALIERYARRFCEALAELDERLPAGPAKLAAYAGLYADVLRKGRMCLCGMLAAEYQTLPEPMRQAVVRFLDESETWLKNTLEEGRSDGALTFSGSPRKAARLIVSGLEGALLVARPYGDPARFEAAADALLAGFAPESASAP
jgi:TetR/AcrR family transcriptional regulator, transcriptional repressor for nem operon